MATNILSPFFIYSNYINGISSEDKNGQKQSQNIRHFPDSFCIDLHNHLHSNNFWLFVSQTVIVIFLSIIYLIFYLN